MKNFISLFLAAFLVAGYVSAQEVDLQIQRAYVYTYYGSGNYNVDFLYVTIQNNGPDDFEGSFNVSASDGSMTGLATFSGTIPARRTAEISVVGTPKDVAYSLYVDTDNKVQEKNENNNYLYFRASEPQVRLTTQDLIAEYLFDTLYVTPGEVYGEQFSVQDMNNHNSIIGAEIDMRTYDLLGDNFYFSTAFGYIKNIQDGRSCFVESASDNWRKNMKVSILANSSEYASRYFWMGDYYGYGASSIGQTGSIYISAKFAQTNLQSGYDNAYRVIKVRDAIRGDVTGNGVVDSEDFMLLKKVVDENLYNSWGTATNMYTNKGINYGVGRILFSQPDFLSVALLNIWLNNPNDPLVQGLGIGELMSATVPGSEASSVKPIDNTFTVSENGEVIIEAPDADVYNVIAQDAEGKMVQRTGRLGEEIILPANAQNIRIETVKIKNGATGLFSPKSVGPKISVYPNPIVGYININSPENGKLSILNLNGQEIYSSSLNANETSNLDVQNWEKGIYLVKIATATGQTTIKVVK